MAFDRFEISMKNTFTIKIEMLYTKYIIYQIYGELDLQEVLHYLQGLTGGNLGIS